MNEPRPNLPVDCGNFLADLPRFLALTESAIEKESIFAHVKSCARCQKNFRTAREIAGAFHGIKSQIERSEHGHINVEMAVSVALRENRVQLAEAFFQLGKSFLLDAINESGWINSPHPKQDPLISRKRAMNAANESALLSQTHHDRMEWDQLRENLSTMTIPETAENLAQEAFRYFSVCQKIVPGFAKAMSGMALYHISRKSYADAIEISKRLLQSSAAVTRRFEAHTNLSVSYYLSENYAQSYFHAQEALRLSPENPAALNNLAIASVLCGDEKTAYAIFDQAEKEDASARELRDRFQQALRCLGNSPLDRFIRSKPKLREDLLSKFPRTFSPVLTTQQNREEV